MEAPLAPTIAAIAAGSFKRGDPPDIRGTGDVVHVGVERSAVQLAECESIRDDGFAARLAVGKM
jgi:hypothetical protein